MNNPTDITITIPAAIAALPGLNLSERATLAHIAKFPGCSNRSLAKLLGISVRGSENILRRLRDAGRIYQVGNGRARLLHLTLPVEHHTLCQKSENAESHTKCGMAAPALAVAKPEMTTCDFVLLGLSFYETCVNMGNYAAARNHLETARKRLEADVDILQQHKAQWWLHHPSLQPRKSPSVIKPGWNPSYVLMQERLPRQSAISGEIALPFALTAHGEGVTHTQGSGRSSGAAALARYA